MDKKIKFRGKSTYDGRWVYGLPRIRDGLDHGIIEESNGMGHDVQLDTITQWTGILDKNGKEIYDGDILGGMLEGGLIRWDKYNCWVVDFDGEISEVHFWELEDIKDLKVIGNKFDNPNYLND